MNQRDQTYPSEVIKIAKECARKYGTDIKKAVEVAEKRIRRLGNWEELCGLFVTHAVSELIYDVRSSDNTRINRSHSQQRVKNPIDSKMVQRVQQSLYQYRLAGTVLGEMRRPDLLEYIGAEERRIAGQQRKVQFATRVANSLPNDKKTVKEVISQRKLKVLHDLVFGDELVDDLAG